MNKNESFIDQIITNMAEKSNRNGTIAKTCIEAAELERGCSQPHRKRLG